MLNDIFYDNCITAGTIKEFSRISQIGPPNAKPVLLRAGGVVDDDTMKTRICFFPFFFLSHMQQPIGCELESRDSFSKVILAWWP